MKQMCHSEIYLEMVTAPVKKANLVFKYKVYFIMYITYLPSSYLQP